MIDDFLTVEDVAAKLKLSKDTVYTMASRKEIPFVKFGRQLRIQEKKFQAWVDRRS